VIFADDIRQEVNGKATFVGTYGTELHASGPGPHMLPQLCALIVYRDNAENLPEELSLKVLLLASEDTVLWDTTVNMREAMVGVPEPSDVYSDAHSTAFAELRYAPRFIPFVFDEDCVLSVRANVRGEEIRLGSLTILLSDQDETNAAV